MSGLTGTEAVLVAMLGNEEFTNRAYELALSFKWEPDVRALIQKTREDERRHGTWIREALRHRPWVSEPTSLGAEAHT